VAPAIALALVTMLPELLQTAPKLGAMIYGWFHANREELPEETLARLDDVKMRQAAEEAEWAADLTPAADGTAATPSAVDAAAAEAALSATVRELSAALQRVKDDNQRLADQLAAEQAKTPAVTGEPEDVANGGPGLFPEDVPPAPEPAGP
jgi:hypothetical protein